MYDIVALGESLVDCTPAGENDQGVALYAANPGGAPANVLAMCSKLGGTAAFIGMAGDDAFGHMLKKNMQDARIHTDGFLLTTEYKTTLAFVQLDKSGNRSFSFYRRQGADTMLRAEQVDLSLITRCNVFHFGSVSLTCDPCRSATLYAAQQAKQAGAVISYDPNYRPLLWTNEKEACAEMEKGLSLCDILKVSEEEMQMFTHRTDPAEGAAVLAERGPKFVFVTMGEKGAWWHTPAGSGHLSVPQGIHAVDTTGAGDAFLGTLLWALRGKKQTQLSAMSAAEWQDTVRLAVAAGSLTTTKKGAIPALPAKEELMHFTHLKNAAIAADAKI